jgi:hypothetical protein
MSACRLHPQLRTYHCDAANRRFGPIGDIGDAGSSRILDLGCGLCGAFNPHIDLVTERYRYASENGVDRVD